MADPEHPRLILQNFLSLDLCKELEFIHKSCSTIGYRPNVFSTTLSHLIATNSAHLILPFVPIRAGLEEQALDGTVMITDLISNNGTLRYGEDFKGGLFHFQDSEPTTIIPMIGDAVMYTADSRNIHCVDEITDGERLTLTLWFSRNGSHDEDAKLISLLSQSHRLLSYKPLPASPNMYWFPPDQASSFQSGFDLRCARMHVLGFDLYLSQHESCLSDLDSSDFSEILTEGVQLIRGDELFDEEFVNILHVLQVVQFYCWKASELQLQTWEKESKTNGVILLSQSQWEQAKGLKGAFLKDEQLAETIFGGVACDELRQRSFDGVSFSAALTSWDSYSSDLHKELLKSLPHWTTHQSIFSVPSVSSEKEA